MKNRKEKALSALILSFFLLPSCSNDVSMGDQNIDKNNIENFDSGDPNDVDDDGIPNDEDNCPTVPNPDQAPGERADVGAACENLRCESNFCEDGDEEGPFWSGYHCNGDFSIECGVKDGCLDEIARQDCGALGCDTETNPGYCALPPPNPNAPQIDSISGTFESGGLVTIAGSDFGSHTLDVEWTGDWIEAQSVGTNPDTKPGWKHFLSLQGPRDHITSDASWSGSKSVDISVDQTKSPLSTESTLGFDHGDYDEIYAVYWTYLEPLAHNMHPASREKTGFKGIYLSLTDHGSGAASSISAPTNAAQTLQSFGESDNQVTGYTWSLWPWLDCDGVSSPSFRVWDDAVGVGYTLHPNEFYTAWIDRGGGSREDHAPSSGRWSRVEIYADAGIPDLPTGEIMHALVDPVAGNGRKIGSWATNVVLRTNRSDCRSNPNPWENFIFQYFFDDTTPESQANVEKATFLLDDVYLQFGTRAHIEVGNRPNYENCTLLEIQPPISWSDSSISFRLNYGGSFEPTDEVFLFVVGDNGKASPGKAITLH